MKNKKEKQKKLQWHPAFCSALRLELLEDAENLEYGCKSKEGLQNKK